jgi:hypothetical protein
MGSQMQVLIDLQENIKEGLHKDPTTLNIMNQVKEGKMRKFWMDNGFLYFGEHIYVPKSSNLHKGILRESHDSPWVGHPGQWRTLALLE